jgi:two-component sensor histidine kinase/CHASE2 domain-containing sensor protein
MFLRRRAGLILFSACAAAFAGMALSRAPQSALAKAELVVQDIIARHGRTTAPNPKLIFLAIDTESVSLDAKADLRDLFNIGDDARPEGRALSLMSEHWPWSREVYALILDRLIGAGAKTVTFDLNFPTPSDHDEEFRKALERYAPRVVIGSNFTASASDSNGRVEAALSLPTNALIPPRDARDSRVGFVNFWPDADEVIRRAQFHANFSQFLDTALNLGEGDYDSLAAQTVRSAGMAEAIPAGTGSHRIRYTAGPGMGFPPRSVFEIFVPEYWTRNFESGRAFDGAIVIVGSAGNWQHDDHQTPFGLMAGAEIQLNVINALVHGEFVRPVGGLAGLLIYLMAVAVAAGLSLRCASPLHRFALLVAAGAAWGIAQFPLYNHAGIVAPVVGPLAVVCAVALVGFVYDLGASLAEQLRLHLTLEERRRTQELLEQANAELERRVAERTSELVQANQQLSGALGEKTVLLKEVHHRVKNNLQVISSLLNLQSGYITDPVALQIFTESRNRVRSMALIHEKLYQSGDLSRINFEDYIRAVSGGLQSTFGGPRSAIRIAVDVEEIMLPVDSAVPCGLIVNELVTNCFKYAFKPGQAGEIRISMKRLNDTELRLSVSDDGIGFPKELDFRNTESLGMQLVATLSEQLDGRVAMKNGCGTTFEISFPENNGTKL